MTMIASMLLLTREDVNNLKIRDAYSLHRIVYDLFTNVHDTANEKRVLYADKGGEFRNRESVRKILILSPCAPNTPQHGEITSKPIPENFLQHNNYGFEVIVNPTKRDNKSGKIVAIRGCAATAERKKITDREAITQWFIEKAQRSWGFAVNPATLQIQSISVQDFTKKDEREHEHSVTQGRAVLKGELTVTNREQFIASFEHGIGRGRAFGFGLLQIVPLASNPFNF